MKNRQSKTNLFIIKIPLLFLGFLFAVVNLYAEEQIQIESALSFAQPEGDPLILSYNEPNSSDVEFLEQGLEESMAIAPSFLATAASSEYCKHELSIWGAGGLSTLYYDPTFGSRTSKLGGAFGLGYTYYFNRSFGILTGAELACYNTKMKGSYEETQRMTNVNIPLAFQYQTGGTHKFYSSLGFKLGIPVSGKYEISGTVNDPVVEPKGDIDFSLSYMGTAEAGVKWSLNRTLSLYTSAYAEYGFNDVVDNKAPRFSADRVSPLAVGLKVRLGVNLCGLKKGKEIVIEERVQPQSKRAKPRTMAVHGDEEEDVVPLPEALEDLRKTVFSGTSGGIRGTITIELEGYELDQSVLSPKMEMVLDEKILEIKRMYGENVRIVVEGHTCNVGRLEYNMQLGSKRANIVRNFLVKRGYNTDRVEAISKGPKQPIAPNDTEANRKKNRRVVLVIRDL